MLREICLDKIYKAFMDTADRNHSEFRINPKHAVGTTLLGPGLIFDLNRVVQAFHSKFEQNISSSAHFTFPQINPLDSVKKLGY